MDNATVLLIGCGLAFLLALVDVIAREAGRPARTDLTSWAVMVLAVTVLWVGR